MLLKSPEYDVFQGYDPKITVSSSRILATFCDVWIAADTDYKEANIKLEGWQENEISVPLSLSDNKMSSFFPFFQLYGHDLAMKEKTMLFLIYPWIYNILNFMITPWHSGK